jgi:23S rRNA (adenine-N6)-dimethyltransferase
MATEHRRSVRYAQNFLTSRPLVERLLDQAHISPDDLVLEIGPGKGIFTEQLARRCREVVAVEKDPILARQLERRFADNAQITVWAGDFLEAALPAVPYKVFASLPFNTTAAIVTRLISAPRPPEDSYLIVQREAAEKFAGQPRESLYAVLLKPWFEPTTVYRFRRADFDPVPGVDVVMLRLRKRGPPLLTAEVSRRFRDFVVHGFTNWQPSVGHGLRAFFEPIQLRHLRRRFGGLLDLGPADVPFEGWLGLFNCWECLGRLDTRARISGAEQRLRAQQARLPKRHRSRTSERSWDVEQDSLAKVSSVRPPSCRSG